MNPGKKVVVTKEGPYVVRGGIPLSVVSIVNNKEGISWDWKEERSLPVEPEYRLCRCGQSKIKPFCDDICKTSHFDGRETARRDSFPDETQVYPGPFLTLRDTEVLCTHARFCMASGGVWNLVSESDKPTSRDIAIRETNHCPSGRLAIHETGKEELIEEEFQPSIGLIEVPANGYSGPLWLRGRIKIESEDGTPYATRNRATLCRCGTSRNKPFCDGNHKLIGFTDGLLAFRDHVSK